MKTAVLKRLQSVAFFTEIKRLKKRKVFNAIKSSKTKNSFRLQQLNPFICYGGWLRVGGRLRNAKIPFSQKYPILLPSYNHVTDLIIRECHFKNLHCGIGTTLNILRNLFWLLDGRKQVRKVIKNCAVCLRANPVLTSCKMGDLLAIRLQQDRPFLNIGIDFCGPFFVKQTRFRNKHITKVYVAIYICMKVKTVHLEVAYDLSTEAFIHTLSNFVSRRGCPITISADNATNFKGANNELRELYLLFQTETHRRSVNLFCNQRNIQWKFIPPLSPNFGGLWESAVKIFKHHLIRVMKNIVLNKDQLTSLVIGIEAVMNSRPITPVSNDPNYLQALTPGHFLIGDSLTCLPEVYLSSSPTNRLSLWQNIVKIKQDFWQQ